MNIASNLLNQRKYDPQGRLSKVWNTLNGTTTVTEIAQTYDELERLASTAMGNSIVSTAFTHDIQNRLRMINNPSSLGTKPFAMELQYNAPNVSGATAQYSGNISAVKWRHNGGGEQSYRYNYGSNNEQGITYDSNGNITALTRTGIQPAAMTYNYSGNRLSSIVKGGTTYTYAHDSNGNVTTDGIRGMTITYNYLNLPKSVAKGTNNLEFIYDATGVRLAIKQNGTTQNYYTGAVVYKSDKTPDYILTSSGMIRKDGANYIRQYNITDHLGNVRSVVNQSGTVEQATDYYPYGLSFSNSNLTKNRYLYNGKEIQNQTLSSQFFGMYDYGARYYDPVIGRWMGVDPAAERYPNISPYAYCANNPIIYIDPDGMYIEDGSQKEWERRKSDVTSQRDYLQKRVDKLTAKAEAKGWSAEKLAGRIGDKNERITSLNTSLGTMGTLESSSQGYSLSHTAAGENGGVTLNTGTNTIDIKFGSGSTGNFVHEVTHAGQFETGDIAFDSKSGMTLAQDIYDEVSAYKAQYAYDPSSVSGLTSTSYANSFGAITTSWVQGLSGGTLYAPGGTANTGIGPLNINSTRTNFINAYPGNPAMKSLPASFILKTSYPKIYYKK